MVEAGAGNDHITAEAHRGDAPARIDCGPGDDSVETAATVDILDPDCDRVDLRPYHLPDFPVLRSALAMRALSRPVLKLRFR